MGGLERRRAAGIALLRSRPAARRRARAAHRPALRRARGPRPRLPAALLALGRVVHARRRARRLDPVLPRAPAARRPRAPADARGGGRRSGMVHEDPAPRSRARHRERLPPAPAPPPARALRQHPRALPGLLLATPLQQELRHPSRQLVRAESSGRGLRRDLRGLAQPRLEVARALPRLAGLPEARVHGPADGRARRPAAASRRARSSSIRCRRCARRCAATTRRSATTTA